MREQVNAQIARIGIIPAVRAASAEEAVFAAETVAHAGIPVVEITMTTPGALDIIASIRGKNHKIVVGAGTVLDLATAKQCGEAGALFLTSPGLVSEVVEYAVANGIVAIPGALTPTEVFHALRAGADYVKIFPCAQVGGPSYIRALQASFHSARLIASGGVTQQNAGEYIEAGASALGVGEHLVPSDALHDHKADWIEELARRFSLMVKTAREKQAEALA